jgi:hypothetical protein
VTTSSLSLLILWFCFSFFCFVVCRCDWSLLFVSVFDDMRTSTACDLRSWRSTHLA